MQKLKRPLVESRFWSKFLRQKSCKFQIKFLYGSDDLRQSFSFHIELELHSLHIGVYTFTLPPIVRKL